MNDNQFYNITFCIYIYIDDQIYIQIFLFLFSNILQIRLDISIHYVGAQNQYVQQNMSMIFFVIVQRSLATDFRHIIFPWRVSNFSPSTFTFNVVISSYKNNNSLTTPTQKPFMRNLKIPIYQLYKTYYCPFSKLRHCLCYWRKNSMLTIFYSLY